MTLDYSKVPNDMLYGMCLDGEEGAWAYVYNYVLGVARSPRWNLRDRPEDMAQQIVLFLLEKGIQQVKTPEAFRGFVKRVAVTKILDSFKKKVPTPESSLGKQEDGVSLLERECSNPGPEAQHSSGQLFKLISELLDKLPEYCARVVPEYFRYRLGLVESYNELSAKLGQPVGTISAQVRRCLDKLSKSPELKEWMS